VASRLATRESGTLFEFLHSRLTRHERSGTYVTWNDMLRLIRKHDNLPTGIINRYKRKMLGDPVSCYPSQRPPAEGCDWIGCKRVGARTKLCSRYVVRHDYRDSLANHSLDACLSSIAVLIARKRIGRATDHGVYLRVRRIRKSHPLVLRQELGPPSDISCDLVPPSSSTTNTGRLLVLELMTRS
jgi:hypothetical protein